MGQALTAERSRPPGTEDDRRAGTARQHNGREYYGGESGSSRWIVLVVMCAVYFLVLLDVMIVGFGPLMARRPSA